MSDYPMLISNKLHSFRNFNEQRYVFFCKDVILIKKEIPSFPEISFSVKKNIITFQRIV